MQAPMRRATRAVMGTVASLAIPAHEVERVGLTVVDAAVAAAWGSLTADDARFSHYRVDSEVSMWARGEVSAEDLSDDLRDILHACAELERDSAGAFAIRSPWSGQLDTAGYVKGWAIERASAAITACGVIDHIIGVGGDARAVGGPQPDLPWQVAIADPQRPGSVAAVVRLGTGAIATSGSSERGDHLWDGRTRDGHLPDRDGLLSFTVLGPTIERADAFATAGFALGAAAGLAWVEQRGCDAMAVLSDGQRPCTAGFLARSVGRSAA